MGTLYGGTLKGTIVQRKRERTLMLILGGNSYESTDPFLVHDVSCFLRHTTCKFVSPLKTVSLNCTFSVT